MFLLPLISLFGPKKGVLSTYLTFFNFKNYIYNNSITNYFKKMCLNLSYYEIIRLLNFNYQFTVLTSRTTVYILFCF